MIQNIVTSFESAFSSWFPYSIIALVLFGFAMVFYKLPSRRGESMTMTTVWFFIASTALSLLFFHDSISEISAEMIGLAFLWAISFTALQILQMKILGKKIETNTLFPVTTTLSLALTVLFAVVVFGDVLSVSQWLGVILVVITVYLFVFCKKGFRTGLFNFHFTKEVGVLGLVIVITSALNKIVQKFAADSFSIEAFQISQYLAGSLFTIALALYLHRSNKKPEDGSKPLWLQGIVPGGLIGVFGFLGGYSLYMAIINGPFALVTSIHSLYILITAIAGWMIFKERLGWRKIVLITLAILAILLIKLGQ